MMSKMIFFDDVEEDFHALMNLIIHDVEQGPWDFDFDARSILLAHPLSMGVIDEFLQLCSSNLIKSRSGTEGLIFGCSSSHMLIRSTFMLFLSCSCSSDVVAILDLVIVLVRALVRATPISFFSATPEIDPPPWPEPCKCESAGLWALPSGIFEVHQELSGVPYPRTALPCVLPEEHVYMNAKQYHGIMRRKQLRAKAELKIKASGVRKVRLINP
ncbi:hypothetical protein RD792_017191 [Penstemon davidsonii]|uniref:Nuclear transcription factor Y subunit n=1 Tax=Penstemon davidsonii TaxID=160366 RepID=A0ABR0CN45_9LAMI|nr:hypothetical protein RD792_017191 [Penstemon davidsonii]